MAPRPTSPADPPMARRSGIGTARTYRPRARTTREAPAQPAGTREAGAAGSARGAAGSARGAAGSARGAGTTRGGGAGKPSQSAPRRRAPRGRPSRGRPSRPPRLADGRRRLRLATVLALTLFAVLGLRLVELQLTDGPAYAAAGREDRLRTVVLPAARGAIYDRNGAVLAHSVEARFVYADPEMVDDPERTAAALQPLLDLPAPELAERMRPRTRPNGEPSRFEWLQRGVDIATAEAVEELNLPGVGVDHDERREVPGHDLAANLIGFTGVDDTGLGGLEARHDDALRGVDGQRTSEIGQGASLDRDIPGGYLVETPAQPGSDLRLTVDMDLQYEVQRVLAERLPAAEATFGAAVVLDTSTGEVLAQASYPTYDATDPLAADPTERADAATTTVFDPGSAHKPFVIGAALEEGAITPEETIVLDPTIRKGDVTFSDQIPHAAGTAVTLPAIMAFSSNVGTIKIADRLGAQRLYEYQRAFGLGEVTGVGMPGEVAGALLAPQDWYGSSYGSVPIGHSVDVTLLQMAAAYAAIANDGRWLRPRLVQAVIDPDGAETPVGEPATRQVLSPRTAATLRELMEAVVTVPGATGRSAAVDGYRVAGKTGTGKLVIDGEYAAGDVASFIGMGPVEDPRYVVAVAAHVPSGSGGETASPAFREIMEFTLNHNRVPPSTTEPPTFDLYP